MRTALLTVLSLGVLCAPALPATAQTQKQAQKKDAPPEVEVNIGVLDQVRPVPQPYNGYRPPQPMLTGRAPIPKTSPYRQVAPLTQKEQPPGEQRPAVQLRPPQPAPAPQHVQQQPPSAPPQQAVSDDAPYSRPITTRRTDETPRIVARPPESFPIKATVRSGSPDPSAGLTQRADGSIAPDLMDPDTVVVSRPVPLPADRMPADREQARSDSVPPAPGRKPTAEDVLASKAPPLPRRRQAEAQAKMAESNKIEGSRPQQAAIVTPPPSASDLASASAITGLPPAKVPPPSPPGRVSRALDAGVLSNAPKVMPAVPAGRVGAEELPAVPGIAVADASDPLLMQLKDFSKDSFVKHVEDATRRHDAAPVPARKPQRGGMPPGLNKNVAAAIPASAERIAALPMEKQAAEALAAIEPAAAGDRMARAPIDRTPRLPPADGQEESAFITVPFMPGDDKATAAILARLDSEVIPLLQQNPGWRIQIQAFSSPDNDVRSSARRTALSRALSVREYLMSKGIEAPRMDIRALGMETDRDPLDRIDLVFFDPSARG